MLRNILRPVVGLLSIAALVGVVTLAVVMFRGGFADTVRITVLSPRAGLVMYPDAKVKMRGVTVGKVASVDERDDGTAAIQLAINSDQVRRIPSNISVDIASSTVFGAKFIELLPPAQRSATSIHAGQIFDSGHVTVEINTIFERLTAVLGQIEPEKLNETLGALAGATDGRGEQVGQMLTDLDSFLAKVEPAYPALSGEIAAGPKVAASYADAAPDLTATAANATTFSKTITDEQKNLDALLVSAIGLGDVGNQVLGDNGPTLTSMLHMLVPTTDLVNEYGPGLKCSIEGLDYLDHVPPAQVPGIGLTVNFLWGAPKYEYPRDLPKVAATGGPQCSVLPVPYNGHPPFLVVDDGAVPFPNTNRTVQLGPDLLRDVLLAPPPAPNGAPK
ncbi:MCE family protein MceA [Nocardia nova SH22a]|uniref:MCE family protein MceA n=1 Tax=Nocardia nova SH22a TaxID=1415166 RepID=W5TAK2_9NOCA|nr:MCE family protein [Nocardia nova]AHH16179.1 MCE family protein MceA [Nocardia nova SH22a]